MKRLIVCDHKEVTILFGNPEGYADSNVKRFVMRAECKHCAEPMRFIGIDAGAWIDKPCTSADGFTAYIPAVVGLDDVEHVKRLHA